jgi:predicted transcriptional regulator
LEVSLEQNEGNSKRSEENLIEKTCRELGVNQKQLAEITGFSVNSITRWNKGDKMTPAVKNHLNLLRENIIIKKKCFELSD